jgi:O-antigen ligase
LWSIAFADGRVFLLIAAITLPMAVIPAVIALWQIGRDVRRRRFDLPMLLLSLNAIVVLFIPQSTFREPLAMARFIVGLIAAAVMYAAARRSARGLRYAQLWIFTLGLALNEMQLPI